MTDKLIILTTVDKEELADRIAAALVERQLAACVNVLPLGLSIYRWKEKIHRDREYILFIKTSGHLFNEVRDTIREIHTYELPEVIALPIAVGEEKVLDWIAASVKPRSH
ncbi:MAG TPA: divalent-cation tolerance protein CutA [Candidatus Polarisedimenticolia bacterium]|nr:divalent-cation tolerance protein CutA [Candidatus Polarisedimenticolia bacterium]